jgi:hypothetical protein
MIQMMIYERLIGAHFSENYQPIDGRQLSQNCWLFHQLTKEFKSIKDKMISSIGTLPGLTKANES